MGFVKRPLALLPAVLLLLAAVGLQGQARNSSQRPEADQVVPGLMGEDPFPRGCVDCHTTGGADPAVVPISVLMSRWYDGVSPALRQVADLAMPTGGRTAGRHPRAERALRDIPAGCISCHGPDSRRAPAFGPLMHLVHLTGGPQNRFLSTFGGECTHCHKLDVTTGVWRVPSAPEG